MKIARIAIRFAPETIPAIAEAMRVWASVNVGPAGLAVIENFVGYRQQKDDARMLAEVFQMWEAFSKSVRPGISPGRVKYQGTLYWLNGQEITLTATCGRRVVFGYNDSAMEEMAEFQFGHDLQNEWDNWFHFGSWYSATSVAENLAQVLGYTDECLLVRITDEEADRVFPVAELLAQLRASREVEDE